MVIAQWLFQGSWVSARGYLEKNTCPPTCCVYYTLTMVLIKDAFQPKERKKNPYLLAYNQLIYNIGRRTNLIPGTHYRAWNIYKGKGQRFSWKLLWFNGGIRGRGIKELLRFIWKTYGQLAVSHTTFKPRFEVLVRLPRSGMMQIWLSSLLLPTHAE